MLLKLLASTVRHVLTFVGGALVTYGWADESMIAQLVGGILTSIGLGWSFVQKAKRRTTPGGTFNKHAEIRKAIPIKRQR